MVTDEKVLVSDSLTSDVYTLYFESDRFARKHYTVVVTADGMLQVDAVKNMVVKKTGEKRVYRFSYQTDLVLECLDINTVTARFEDNILMVSAQSVSLSDDKVIEIL